MKENLVKVMEVIGKGWDWVCTNWFKIEPYNIELTISNAPIGKKNCENLEWDLLDEGTDCEVTKEGKVRTYSKYYREVKEALDIFGHSITRMEVLAR